MDLPNWFDANYKSFPDEFEWWDEEMDKLENQDEEIDLEGIESEDGMLFFTIENIFEKFESFKEAQLKIDTKKIKKTKIGKKSFSQSKKSTEPKIYQLKITLKDIKPPIWRRILISNQANFHTLHLTIQNFFNWGNYHLHEFNFPHENNPRNKISLLGLDPEGNIPDDLDDGFLNHYETREDEVKLSNIFSKNCQTVGYLYDFGDNWEHSIKLEKVFSFKKGFKGPLCVGGKKAAPPEDCGGPWGYQDLLNILNNKHHPEYNEMKEWVNPTFNPEKIDVQISKLTLKQIEERYGPSIPI